MNLILRCGLAMLLAACGGEQAAAGRGGSAGHARRRPLRGERRSDQLASTDKTTPGDQLKLGDKGDQGVRRGRRQARARTARRGRRQVRDQEQLYPQRPDERADELHARRRSGQVMPAMMGSFTADGFEGDITHPDLFRRRGRLPHDPQDHRQAGRRLSGGRALRMPSAQPPMPRSRYVLAGRQERLAMIGYVTLGSDNMPRARAFYDELLGTVGAKRIMEFGDDLGGFTMWGTGFDKPAIAVTNPYNEQPAIAGNGNMTAIAMDSRDQGRRALRQGAGAGRDLRRPAGPARRGRSAGLLRRLFPRPRRQQARRLLHRPAE